MNQSSLKCSQKDFIKSHYQNSRLKEQAVSLKAASRGEEIPSFSGDKERLPTSTSPLGGEQGSLYIGAILMLAILTLIATLSLKTFVVNDEKSFQRKNAYLCLKGTFDLWSHHQKFIKNTNKTILALQTALALKPNPVLLKMIRATQRWQDLKSFTSWKKAIKNKSCQGLQIIFLRRTFPVKLLGLKVRRNPIGLAYLKRKPVNFKLPSHKSWPFFFLIKGKVLYEPKLTLIDSREISLEGIF